MVFFVGERYEIRECGVSKNFSIIFEIVDGNFDGCEELNFSECETDFGNPVYSVNFDGVNVELHINGVVKVFSKVLQCSNQQ